MARTSSHTSLVYVKWILELPTINLNVQHFKYAKARLGMILSKSSHIAVRSTATALSAGRTWNSAGLQAQAALIVDTGIFEGTFMNSS